MVHAFSNLSQEESDLMLKVPLLVTILIAGADGNIDKSEVREAISIAKGKRTRARKELREYYNAASENFEENLKSMIESLPKDAKSRTDELTSTLSQLNDILQKLDATYAIKFLESTKDLARKIAEASGGILGYMSIGYEESKLIDLSMIKNLK